MTTAAEKLNALLSKQHVVLAQLKPSQRQLFRLVAKLKGLSLEESHAESKASFDQGMNDYHKVFNKFQEAQAQLSALNLKFFRPGANASGESDVDEDARRIEEEEKCGDHLFAQIGKLSDEKFLNICNEQRDVVDQILNCSTTLRDGLDGIIVDNSNPGVFPVDDGVEFDFSSDEHFVRSYGVYGQSQANNGSQQSNLGNTQSISSEGNDLHQELASARAEILRLRTKIIELERGHTSFEQPESSEVENEELVGNAAPENDTNKLAIANEKIHSLDVELKKMKPLFDIGVKVRCGFLQSVKRVWHGGQYRNTHYPPTNDDVIRARNVAAHRGNFVADKALFDLEILKTDDDKDSFEYTYQIPSYYNVAQCPQALQLVNHRGTLMACGFLTEYTYNTPQSNKATEEAFNFYKSLWLPIISQQSSGRGKWIFFSNTPVVERKIKAIMQITEATVKKVQEQKRKSG